MSNVRSIFTSCRNVPFFLLLRISLCNRYIILYVGAIHKFMRRMKPNNVCNQIGNYLITFLYWAQNPGPTVLEMILSEASQSSHLFDLLILILLQHCRLHDRLHSAHVWIVGRIWAWVGNFHTWAIMIFYKTIL